jgi:hypothetical protein
MTLAARSLGLTPRIASSLGDLANALLERFPQLRTAQARSLGEAIDIVLPWIKSAAIAGVTAAAVTAIGTAAFALTTKVLLCLCVLALALYVFSRVGPPGVRERLDELFQRINREFTFAQNVGPVDLQRALAIASQRAVTTSRIA